MNIALISDSFPPERISSANQLKDLALELKKQGVNITVIVASPYINQNWIIEDFNNIPVLRLRTFKIRDVSNFKRGVYEFLMPFLMLKNYYLSPLKSQIWNSLIWYSPSIFLSLFIRFLKISEGGKKYLIIRDIFPEWAYDLGLIKKRILFFLFKSVANYQNSIADIIGIQARGNSEYFKQWEEKHPGRLHVLNNWLSESTNVKCSIDISKTKLSGKKIFVYAGNIGIAQDLFRIIDLAELLKNEKDIGFLFVGRGSTLKRLIEVANFKNLSNIIFFDEIDSSEIPGLYNQCSVGLLALDFRHKTQNIPGKFLSYMQYGLPVFACVNKNNELVDLINKNRVGRVVTSDSIFSIKEQSILLLNEISNDFDKKINLRCKKLFKRNFSTERAANQIMKALLQ